MHRVIIVPSDDLTSHTLRYIDESLQVYQPLFISGYMLIFC
jgi:hypothetical protein